jgi:hypothetical protein
MKRLVLISALVALLLSVTQVCYLYLVRDFPMASASTSSKSQLGLGAQTEAVKPFDIPVGVSRTVEFTADESLFRDYTARERKDQYRDWLLFAAVSAFQPSVEDYNKIVFDLPTTRHGYMRPVGNFEFGETRSRFIGDGRVLAVIPAARSVDERKDLLAHIADEHRKSQGGEFSRLIVIEYELDSSYRPGMLTRREDVEYALLYSAEYGYHEKEIAKLRDLEQFMAVVDDLTAVKKVPNGLVLGGRKILNRKYRPISVEQVATIWQSEKQIQEAEIALADFKGRWEHRTYRRGDETQRQRLQGEHDREWNALTKRLKAGRSDLKPVGGSGFSLDIGGDGRKLSEALESWQSSKALSASQKFTVSNLSQVLAGGNMIPFIQFTHWMEVKGDRRYARELKQLEREHLYQAARYDGDLQGTEVGMILFYTDLLAKLWTIDFINSSPRRDRMPDFVDHPTAPDSLIYLEERNKLDSGRLWFGESNFGFQIADMKNAVYLARNATRLYSAATDPDHPGKEVESSASMAAPIDWWNDHYEEVARYEQEYERLNQVMKWSIVISWLNEQNEGARLSFLDNVHVDRSKVFPDWVSSHPQLRFQRWRDVGFYEAGHNGTRTESLPVLWGPVTGGGVSLASKEGIAKRGPISVDVEKTLRRSNLAYATSTGNTTLKTLDETVFTLNSRGTNQFSVIAKPKSDAKLRAATAQLAHTDIERIISSNVGTLSFETHAGTVPISNLEIGRSSNGFRIGWRAREIDRAHSYARTLSVALDPDSVLLGDPMLQAVVKFPDDATYAIKLNGSPNWLRLAPEENPSVDIATGWQLRASEGPPKAKRAMQASVIDDARLREIIGAQQSLIVENSPQGKTFLRVSSDQPPSGSRLVEVTDGNTDAHAWISPSSQRVHLVVGDGDGIDAVKIAQRLSPKEFNEIQEAASKPHTVSVPVSPESRLRAELPTDLASQQFRKAAAKIANNLDSARLALRENLRLDLKRNVAIRKTKGADEALHDLDRLIATYGRRPDLTLRRGLYLIDRGNIEAAAENVQTTVPRVISDRRTFFDEVNARWASNGGNANGDLYRYAQYADWQDRLAQPGSNGRVNGSLHALRAGNHFDFELRLAEMPPGHEVSLAEIEQSSHAKAVVYRQDDVRLNSLDWASPVDQALRQVVSGRLGRIVRLSQQDIAYFRPSVVYMPDDAVHLKPVQPHSYTSHLSVRGYQYCNTADEVCPNGDSSQKEGERKVYLVLAN